MVVKDGVFDPPILFLEFAELLKAYLESKEVAEPIPVCLDKNCEFEEKKARITSVLIEKASTCMGPAQHTLTEKTQTPKYSKQQTKECKTKAETNRSYLSQKHTENSK